jgi:hypothetical protein
VVLKKKAA